MKKANKKIFGLFGLVLVVAMTIFAAFLPSPRTSAASSVTDTVIITVVNESQPPTASILNPDSGDKFLTPDQEIEVNYANIKNYQLTIKYIDAEGHESAPVTIADVTNPDPVSTDSYNFRPYAEMFGYGTYVVQLAAVGDDDSAIPDTITFKYVAIDASVSTDEETGLTYVDLDYDPNQDSLTEDLRIDTVVINVYDKDGNIVKEISPIIVEMPTQRVEIPFGDDIASGKYTLVVEAYNSDGDSLYETKNLDVDYDGEIVVPSTADTGGLFKNLNIAKSDYLISGVGLFFAACIGSLIFISRRKKTTNRRRK